MGSKKGKRKAETPRRPKLSSSADRASATSRVSSTPRAEPTGRREPRFTTIVPVRFEPAMLEAVRARAAADDRSVSAWIRRIVEAELGREANGSRGGAARAAAAREHDAGDDAR